MPQIIASAVLLLRDMKSYHAHAIAIGKDVDEDVHESDAAFIERRRIVTVHPVEVGTGEATFELASERIECIRAGISWTVCRFEQ